jgi:CO/xanthine dehydrogenase Mo-binding subunit
VPVQWWRSVGSTHTGFSTEVFIDELAGAAGKDPVAYRMALLEKHPRHAGVLKLAADKAGWGKPLAAAKDGAKRGRGVAVHESFASFVAQVVEVTVQKDGTFKVDRVVCAVDCGIAVNPDVIAAQMEGGIGYALAAALTGAITLKEGVRRTVQLHRLPDAAHQRNAEGRGAYRRIECRQADRRWRTRRTADCTRAGECTARRHRQAHPHAADR